MKGLCGGSINFKTLITVKLERILNALKFNLDMEMNAWVSTANAHEYDFAWYKHLFLSMLQAWLTRQGTHDKIFQLQLPDIPSL